MNARINSIPGTHVPKTLPAYHYPEQLECTSTTITNYPGNNTRLRSEYRRPQPNFLPLVAHKCKEQLVAGFLA